MRSAVRSTVPLLEGHPRKLRCASMKIVCPQPCTPPKVGIAKSSLKRSTLVPRSKVRNGRSRSRSCVPSSSGETQSPHSQRSSLSTCQTLRTRCARSRGEFPILLGIAPQADGSPLPRRSSRSRVELTADTNSFAGSQNNKVTRVLRPAGGLRKPPNGKPGSKRIDHRERNRLVPPPKLEPRPARQKLRYATERTSKRKPRKSVWPKKYNGGRMRNTSALRRRSRHAERPQLRRVRGVRRSSHGPQSVSATTSARALSGAFSRCCRTRAATPGRLMDGPQMRRRRCSVLLMARSAREGPSQHVSNLRRQRLLILNPGFRDAEEVKGDVCAVVFRPPQPPQTVTQTRQRDEPRSPARSSSPRYSPPSGGGRAAGTMQGIQ
jgi:hypothetical protein